MITHVISQSGHGVVERTPEEIREAIQQAQDVMATMPQVEIPVTHHFSDGIYGREIFIPKGTLFTGKIHKQTDLSCCLSGLCEILTPHGWVKCETGDVILSRKGTKPLARALEDTRWMTSHATTLTDLDELEEFLFEDEGPSSIDFKTGKPVPQTISERAI